VFSVMDEPAGSSAAHDIRGDRYLGLSLHSGPTHAKSNPAVDRLRSRFSPLLSAAGCASPHRDHQCVRYIYHALWAESKALPAHGAGSRVSPRYITACPIYKISSVNQL
jgi:hypothetical protein